ncbi:CHASE3 domain-containing protein, partial [Brevundimonas sp.]|uniref:CHASE3 domain-containing protein n=1 Tax=Brevundimonas sp. TaxID=1871086 RepID=UPI0037BE9E8A
MKFIENMPVGRKLFAAFALVLAAIVVMGAVVITNLLALENADKARSAENAMNRAAARAEYRLAKQENSYRGYLLSKDPYYLERIDGHRDEFKKALEELRADLPQERRAPIDKAIQASDGWYANVVKAGQALVAQGRTAEAEAMVGEGGVADTFIKPIEAAVDELKATNQIALDAAREAQAAAAKAALVALCAGLAVAIVLAVIVGVIATRSIVVPTLGMIGYMQKLMGGDTSIQVIGADRKDEFGKMGQAIVAFRDAAIEKVRVEAEAASHRSMSENERLANEAEKARVAEEDRIALTALAGGLSA